MVSFHSFGTYVLNILIAFDRMVNAAITGDPDETLSSVAFRKNRDKEPFGFMMNVINTLFWFQPHHCAQAYSDDRNRVLQA